MTDWLRSFATDLKAICQERGDAPALVDALHNTTLSYAELLAVVERWGAFFTGCGADGRVLSLLPNSVEALTCFQGAVRAGRDFVPLPEDVSIREVRKWVKLVGPTVCVVPQDLSQEVASVMTGAGAELVELPLDGRFDFLPERRQPAAPAAGRLLLATSGSTGEPKALVLDCDRLWSAACAFVSRYAKLDHDARFWNLLPVSYLGGLFNLGLIPLAAGGSVVVSEAFSANTFLSFWKTVADHRINTLWLVPTILRGLLRFANRKTAEENARLARQVRICLLGTAPVDLATKLRFEELFQVPVFENFGLSETTFISAEAPGSPTRCEGSVGEVLPWAELKLVPNSDEPDAPSEVYVRTPFAFEGYLGGDGSVSADRDADGFLATGDLGHLEGRTLVIDGRLRDIIKKGGYFIRLREIEILAESHEGVAEAVAVRTPHDFYGESYVLFVRPVQADDPKEFLAGFKSWLHQELVRYKHPESVHVVGDFPRTRGGKIRKHVLAEFKGYFADKQGVGTRPPLELSRKVQAIPEALSIYINQLVYNLKRKGERVITLSLGEAFFDIPLFDFTRLDVDKGYHYSDSRGIPGLRQKIAEFYQRQYRAPVYPDEIVVSAGSKPIIFLAMAAVLNPGDEVLIHEPGWLSYPHQATLAGGKPAFIPYDCPVADFHRHFTDRTKLVVINNPNNPSGRLYHREELADLYEQCRSRGILVLVDEAYSDFLVGERFVSMADVVPDKDGVIIVNSLSKNMGMSGWRIGYSISSKEVNDLILRINQHVITCAPTILAFYVQEYFDQIIEKTLPQVDAVVRKRARIAEMFRKLGIEVLPGACTFYFFASIEPFPGDDMDFALELLINKKIAVVPGSAYGASTGRFVRISIGTEPEEDVWRALQEIDRLRKVESFDPGGLRERAEEINLFG